LGNTEKVFVNELKTYLLIVKINLKTQDTQLITHNL